ncbi:unnamed protein product [Caenorhabditis bovis]|uniref:SWI/SNF-related matrix-associated actin-dependent regulator of chromatin subfamily A containing DEAD/H box 1 homolog n=1 Tax=Caenorhabditis bovis TaxID=2654633 RepID=A0A8S1EVE8_9PELO|nr:unnamed protein product [Caenorhabditis bovis]
MSTCKFDSGERVRVAHRGNPQSSNLQEEMLSKKNRLAQMLAGGINSKKTPTKNSNRKYGVGKAKKSRKASSDEDDDDEFIDDANESTEEPREEFEEDDDDFDDEEEVTPRVRKTPAKKKITDFLEFKVEPKKQRTLSDSSDDEEEWLGKPRLDGKPSPTKNVMKTSAASRKAPLKKKKIVISDDDDDDRDEFGSEPEEPIVDEKKNRKKMESDEDYDDDDEPDADGDETPSSDSDAEERREKRSENRNQKACREYFNTAPKDDILLQPRVNDKIAQFIIDKRPFVDFNQMFNTLKGITRGVNAIDAYMEHLEKRGILERILDDCKDHAEAVARDFERFTTKPIKLSLLKEGCSLHDYQEIGVKWLMMMHKKDLNAILGDEMGLGKTIQIVAFLSYLKQEGVNGPHLIVVPSSTIENWIGEFQKWCPSLKVLTYYGNQDERRHLRHRVKKQKAKIDVILTTYNMVTSKTDDKKFFKNFSLNYVIYDEGHMLKNCDSERYRGLMKVKGRRKILLTGTPLQNNLIELISLMYFVLSKVFNKYCEDITHLLQHFKQIGPALDDKNRQMYQQDRIEQAKAILQPYILRRLKTQVLGALPPKTENVIEVDMQPAQEEFYNEILETFRRDHDSFDSSQGSLMRLRQAANHPLLRRLQYTDQKLDKIAKVLCAKEKQYETKKWEHVSEDMSFMSDMQIHQLCEKFTSTTKFLLDENLALQSGKIDKLDQMLPEIQKKGDKVLIFSQFTSMLDILEVYMQIRGYQYKRLDGQTPVMERQEMINEFNVSKDLFIFLLSTKAGGLGINLTSANHIIIHDIDFNPYNDKQAEDRCHRMGQLKPVFVTRLVSKRTVEVGMLALAKKKLKLERQVTTGIKGQIEEDENAVVKDDEEEAIDSNTLNKLLSTALERKSLCEVERDSRSPSAD